MIVQGPDHNAATTIAKKLASGEAKLTMYKANKWWYCLAKRRLHNQRLLNNNQPHLKLFNKQ